MRHLLVGAWKRVCDLTDTTEDRVVVEHLRMCHAKSVADLLRRYGSRAAMACSTSLCLV